jgi:hypothetical protein
MKNIARIAVLSVATLGMAPHVPDPSMTLP